MAFNAPEMLSAIGLLVLQSATSTNVVPTSTTIHVTLMTSVSSQSAHRGDPVSGVLIAPIQVGSRVIPFGTMVLGQVDDVAAHSLGRQARLRLHFTQLDLEGAFTPIAANVAAVDNARETVDSQGTILGPRTQADSKWGRMELLGLAAFVPELFVLDAAGSRFREGARVDIAYQAGVDLDLKVARPVSFSDDATREAPAVRSLPASFADMARTLPLRTAAGQPPRPADLMNLVFVGPADVLADAFRRAGWSTADRLNARDDVKAFLAIASREGYRTAPVSLETVDGRVPDAVFQKQTNTFAKRHHVRIWRQGSWAGQPLWVAAGTHDIGVKFDSAEHSFTHRVEQQVDVERDKIANDLAFAGVMPAAYVDRPNAPRSVQNATGDGMRTDGRLAVLFLADSN